MLPTKILLTIAASLTGVNSLVIPSLDQISVFKQILGDHSPYFENAQGVVLGKAGSFAQEVIEIADSKLSEIAKAFKLNLAPIYRSASIDNLIPHKYIVVFDEDISSSEIATHKLWLETLEGEFNHFNLGDMLGYIGYLNPELVSSLQKMKGIKFIEQDSVMHTNEFDIQKEAPWGLARVSHRFNSAPVADYLHDNEGGKGVTAYVIDTGIKVEHEEFEDRAIWGKAVAVPFIKFDGNGHGTHCAGIIGSKTYGVAKKVDLVAVGVMNLLGSGTTSDIIKGVEFVVNDHNEKLLSKGFKGSTVNLSIGGGISEALDLAVNAGTKAGLHIAVAGGNDNADSCEYSPARASGPITVGATNVGDARASFSNWGKCTDIFAPGEDILSTYIWDETARLSGTSMAAPHITGLLSYYLSLQPESTSEFSAGGIIDPENLKKKLIKYGTKGVISGLDRESPNVLAFNGAGGNLTEFWAN